MYRLRRWAALNWCGQWCAVSCRIRIWQIPFQWNSYRRIRVLRCLKPLRMTDILILMEEHGGFAATIMDSVTGSACIPCLKQGLVTVPLIKMSKCLRQYLKTLPWSLKVRWPVCRSHSACLRLTRWWKWQSICLFFSHLHDFVTKKILISKIIWG